MDRLIEKYRQKIGRTSLDFMRSTVESINWKARLIGIKGPRGVGKTTLMLQYIKTHLSDRLAQVLYVSLDDIWFSNNRLVDLADDFVKQGGTHLFLDEVHKYPNWSQELKNIYDDHTGLQIVFTGSSLLEILNARADLSRRAGIYLMQGLSFREYVSLEYGHSLSALHLSDILEHHLDISGDIVSDFKPLQYFSDYLKHGYYPYYREEADLYAQRVEETINMILEIELPMLRAVDIAYVSKVKQLLLVIAESAPFIPNVSKISEKIGINRTTLLSYLHYLQESGLTHNLFRSAKGISRLQKPDKIFLENTNLAYIIGNADIGNVRETFFANQLSYRHQLEFPEKGDFLIDSQYVFEVGGKDKAASRLKGVAEGYVAADGIEYGTSRKIPLWLFGLLY
ncbi:ATPase AAA [Parapedobacter pyrenivorans]|uniref:ATPase AAA n=1 Tax=Parapedobacter pyrenivorans TaxID=1305674 RepID=A0A917I0U1_9SPHI|nr:AAA family ATPase [Parapedobacter pyrenivorans]GGG99885.1 ATPase AAA [Parapedobacter pyrenivorans]